MHPQTIANYLASPPLVVAFALAGTVLVDFEKEALGKDKDGKEVFLRDIWPSQEEVQKVADEIIKPEMFIETYKNITKSTAHWSELKVEEGLEFKWDPEST